MLHPRHGLDRWTAMVQARPFLSPFILLEHVSQLRTS